MAKKKVFTDESLQTFVEEIKAYTDDSVSNVSTVEVSETEPTKESVDLWINPTNEDAINIPEVNDETTSSEDTWSSNKINNEISTLKESIVEEVGGDTLTWDGNTEGLEGLDFLGNGTIWYKVSENAITMNDLSNGASITLDGQPTDITEGLFDSGAGMIAFDVGAFVSENTEGIAEGIYLMQGVTSITINGYAGFTTTKIKEELLPESVYEVKAMAEESGTSILSGSYSGALERILNNKQVKLMHYLDGFGMFESAGYTLGEEMISFYCVGAGAILTFNLKSDNTIEQAS